MTNDNITVSRELLRQAIEALENIAITGPDDDGVVWLNLPGNGTTGKAIIRVGKSGLIASQCATLAGEQLRSAADALRTALEQPAVEPVRPDVLEKLSYHCLERDDLTLDDCLTYLQTNGWHKVRGRTERSMLLQLTALMAASPPPPAEVPLLTDDELDALEVRERPANGPKSTLNFARAIEQAVRQKAGLK